MLFLFNDRLLNLGAVPGATTSGALLNAVRAGREAMFAAGDTGHLHGEVIRDIACQIAAASPANAALIVRPPKAKRPDDVGVRLAEVSLPTLAFLAARANAEGVLPALMVNQHVWMVAAAAPKP
jgi:hypothetical protein